MAAPIILSNCYIKINSVEYSGKTTKAAISMSAETHDITAMGDFFRKNIGGMRDWGMAFEFIADEAVTGQAFFDMIGDTVAIEVRPSAGAVSTTNPVYIGQGVISEYSVLDGEVGDVHKLSLTVVSAGELQRRTTPVV